MKIKIWNQNASHANLLHSLRMINATDQNKLNKCKSHFQWRGSGSAYVSGHNDTACSGVITWRLRATSR